MIGYEKGAAIAKKAYAEGKPIIESGGQEYGSATGRAESNAGSRCTDRGRHQGWYERGRLMEGSGAQRSSACSLEQVVRAACRNPPST